MIGFLLIFGAISTLLGSFSAILLVKPLRERVKKILIQVKESFIFSGLIQTLMVTYLKNFATFYFGVLLLKEELGLESIPKFITTVLIGLPLTFFPIWSCVFLIYYKDELWKE